MFSALAALGAVVVFVGVASAKDQSYIRGEWSAESGCVLYFNPHGDFCTVEGAQYPVVNVAKKQERRRKPKAECPVTPTAMQDMVSAVGMQALGHISGAVVKMWLQIMAEKSSYDLPEGVDEVFAYNDYVPNYVRLVLVKGGCVVDFVELPLMAWLGSTKEARDKLVPL